MNDILPSVRESDDAVGVSDRPPLPRRRRNRGSVQPTSGTGHQLNCLNPQAAENIQPGMPIIGESSPHRRGQRSRRPPRPFSPS
jgi:hypothetical protein